MQIIMVDKEHADDILHYGVPGMKWGKRKALTKSDIRKEYENTRSAVKQTKKAYNKAYNSAYNYSARHPISQYTSKKKSAEADRRWDDAIDKAKASGEAKKAFKTASKTRRDRINETARKFQKDAKFRDKIMYNTATRKRAAKYVVDNNMSVSDANKRAKGDAWRNTATILAAIGTYHIAKGYLK